MNHWDKLPSELQNEILGFKTHMEWCEWRQKIIKLNRQFRNICEGLRMKKMHPRSIPRCYSLKKYGQESVHVWKWARLLSKDDDVYKYYEAQKRKTKSSCNYKILEK
jgi:hypothetical protein